VSRRKGERARERMLFGLRMGEDRQNGVSATSGVLSKHLPSTNEDYMKSVFLIAFSTCIYRKKAY
jgi:hypothetical protein